MAITCHNWQFVCVSVKLMSGLIRTSRTSHPPLEFRYACEPVSMSNGIRYYTHKFTPRILSVPYLNATAVGVGVFIEFASEFEGAGAMLEILDGCTVPEVTGDGSNVTPATALLGAFSLHCIAPTPMLQNALPWQRKTRVIGRSSIRVLYDTNASRIDELEVNGQ